MKTTLEALDAWERGLAAAGPDRDIAIDAGPLSKLLSDARRAHELEERVRVLEQEVARLSNVERPEDVWERCRQAACYAVDVGGYQPALFVLRRGDLPYEPPPAATEEKP